MDIWIGSPAVSIVVSSTVRVVFIDIHPLPTNAFDRTNFFHPLYVTTIKRRIGDGPIRSRFGER
jgi:hypothetical protein